MVVDMVYNGQKITWLGMGTFKATSGLIGYQDPEYYCVPDSGPIPEGLYKIFLADQGIAKDDGTGRCAIKPAWGIQSIPRGAAAGSCEPYWQNWGNNRVRMEPADTATKIRCSPLTRGGFYLHDSTKGYSHGCIEVEGRIFAKLRDSNKSAGKSLLTIQVEYTKGKETNGGTKV